ALVVTTTTTDVRAQHLAREDTDHASHLGAVAPRSNGRAFDRVAAATADHLDLRGVNAGRNMDSLQVMRWVVHEGQRVDPGDERRSVLVGAGCRGDPSVRHLPGEVRRTPAAAPT